MNTEETVQEEEETQINDEFTQSIEAAVDASIEQDERDRAALQGEETEEETEEAQEEVPEETQEEAFFHSRFSFILRFR